MKKFLLLAAITILPFTQAIAGGKTTLEFIMDDDVKKPCPFQITYWDSDKSKHHLYIEGQKALDFTLLYPGNSPHTIDFDDEKQKKEYFIDCLVQHPFEVKPEFRATPKVTFEKDHNYKIHLKRTINKTDYKFTIEDATSNKEIYNSLTDVNLLFNTNS